VELSTAIPRHKHDLEAARSAVALGWPAVAPIAPQLLEWVQDMNWPVAPILAPLLASAGASLATNIRDIFKSEDEVWKYFVIQAVVAQSNEMCRVLQSDLRRIASQPTAAEHKEEVDLVAREALERM